MKNVSKELSLGEIKLIGEKLRYLLSIPMKAGISYKIAQWGRPFRSKSEDIAVRADNIILKYCNEGETTVPADRNGECIKELDEFYKNKDTVEFSKFELSWVEDLFTTDISILHQFMDDELFREEAQ